MRDDVVTSAMEEVNARRERAIAGGDLRQKAREALRDRLRPDRSGISLRDLDEASPETRAKVEALAREVVGEMQRQGLAGQGPVIRDDEADAIVKYLMDIQFGAGALEYLFHERDVEDIVINTVPISSTRSRVEVWTYRQSGKRREPVEVSPEEVLEVINRNAAHQGRALNPTSPILNAQMRNGARINAVLNPVCDPYLSVTIRIHRLVARSFADLVRLGTLSEAAAAWLWLCVRSRLAMVVSGGTGSGKTNFLNAIARIADPHERIVAIEDTRELDLAVEDKVYLTTVQSSDTARAVTQRHLVANALRMRPDRIVLGEVRDAAAWDAIKACNTGHDGTLLTLHAEDAEGVMDRLMQLCGEAPETANIPEKTMREIIAQAFQVIVFLQRRRQPDGSFRRGVVEIMECNGYVRDGKINLVPIFALSPAGRLEWTGHRPHERIKRRIFDAGFSEQDIEDALNGRAQHWRSREG